MGFPIPFDLQGHRGARGLRPENTLSSFEIALDLGVTSIETDLHLTRDGVPVLCHDSRLSEPIFTSLTGAPLPVEPLLVSQLCLHQLRRFRAAGNPDPRRFPRQKAEPTPLALAQAEEWGLDPHAVPTLADLFNFVAAYAGEPGRQAGKTDEQRRRAGQVHFDLELKRVPFFPEAIGDDFDGENPGQLEQSIVEAIHTAGLLERCSVRSFDHRAVRALLHLEPALTGGVLLANTMCIDPLALVEAAGARAFYPSYEFLNEKVVRRLQVAGVRTVPWTVNAPSAWGRLIEWGVAGITTDDPDRLADFVLSGKAPYAGAGSVS